MSTSFNYPVLTKELSRLAKCALKLDAYFSLDIKQSTTIDLRELDLSLTSTWAMWNANGLHVFFPRAQNEPVERNQYRMSQLAGFTGPRIPFTLLAEDIELILLGMTKDVWQHRQRQRNKFLSEQGLGDERERLTQQLNFCKDQLTQMMALPNDGDEEAIHLLLRSYAGFESGPNSTPAAIARFLRFVSRGIFLYAIHDLNLSADLEHLSDVLSRGHDRYSELSLQKQAATAKWAASVDGRTALVRAMIILGLCESISGQTEKGLDKDEPVMQLALIAAATVVRAWITRALPSCTCLADLPASDVMNECTLLAESPELESWKHIGGKLLYKGENICCCNIHEWRQRFADRLHRPGWARQLNDLWPLTE
ncbi:hypothetical protein K4F52_009388 [Lecanicillium sp. MT-2017a]|nr:hypothetical protein K4F52_009388 [Lecanicillium sp. MT-2017a]